MSVHVVKHGERLSHIEGGETIENLISRADRALYATKDAGRNRGAVLS